RTSKVAERGNLTSQRVCSCRVVSSRGSPASFGHGAPVFGGSDNFSLSLLSPDLTYECFSVNPLTGSPCSCRRSPRLLSNGYYVLTEDSYVFDDDGNVSLTPSKTNVSYKENLVRIFRRRRRSRRSLASLFGVTSSWLESSVFEAVYRPPLGESSWSEESTPGLTKDCDFIYDHSTPQKPGHASCLKEEGELSVLDTEACFSKEQFSQSLGGFLDVPPPSPFNTKSCCHHRPRPSDRAMVTAFFLIFLTVSLFTALFSRSLLAGVAVGSITFTLILTSFFLVKSTFRTTVNWARTKTEDISSRNE
uniref:Transmembrane protein 71 n=1 Tax=Paramormyrops kingsleyae TaxID=1676925 RepID=A0A3B3RY94_9TELE